MMSKLKLPELLLLLMMMMVLIDRLWPIPSHLYAACCSSQFNIHFNITAQ
jgi:hypothetical protein